MRGPYHFRAALTRSMKGSMRSGDATIPVPIGEIELHYTRSSGPGGQNVNKVNSKAVLRWPVISSRAVPEDVRRRFADRFRRRITVTGDLVISSDRYRDRERNREDCLGKLRAMLAEVASPPPRRRKTRPTRAAVERRLREKRSRSETKRRRRSSED